METISDLSERLIRFVYRRRYTFIAILGAVVLSGITALYLLDMLTPIMCLSVVSLGLSLLGIGAIESININLICQSLRATISGLERQRDSKSGMIMALRQEVESQDRHIEILKERNKNMEAQTVFQHLDKASVHQ